MTFNDMTRRERIIRAILQFLFALFVLCLFFVIIFIIYSSFTSAIPIIKPYVNDFVGVLSSSQIQTLNEFLSQLEGDTTYEIAVVITKDTEGQDANSYATAIGNENGVGQEGKENGIVVLVATESRDIYIAVGRGAESIISDAEAGRIGRDNAKIYFPNGQYYEGIYHIVEDLSTEIRKPSNAVTIVETITDKNLDGANTPDNVSINVFWGIVVIIFLIFSISLILGLFRNLFSEPEPKHYGKRKVYDDDDEDDSSSSYIPAIIPVSTGGFSSGSSGGGGFGSFGGGSFGGGGGGGKW